MMDIIIRQASPKTWVAGLTIRSVIEIATSDFLYVGKAVRKIVNNQNFGII